MSPKKIKLLLEKKHRKETGLFIVEGEKSILELLESDLLIEALLGTKEFLNTYRMQIDAYQDRLKTVFDITEVEERVLVQSGSLLSNNAGIAVVHQKDEVAPEEITQKAQQTLILVLDDVRDPGNLGTILRTADWYGVTHIVASETTTDLYNPKVIASSMGSYTRMQVAYMDLADFLETLTATAVPIIIADMHGKDIHEEALPSHGALIMGSESHGIGEISKKFATHAVTIPRFGNAESLNVSVATGILLDAIRRGS